MKKPNYKYPMYVICSTLFLLTGSQAMAGDPGACYSISDADTRNYCLAKAHQDSSRCYAIQDSSKRSECIAEVRR